MSKMHTEIEINATPDVVWNTLIDFPSHQVWNPFVVAIEGTPEVGERLEARLQLPEGMASTIKPTVTAVEENRYLEWLGSMGVRGLFDGRHQFKLEATPDGTKFIQSEEFTGILAPLFMMMIRTKTQAGFELMNQAIKQRTEEAVTKRS